MKVALVHDYIKEYGGAERVLEALHEVYPDSTVFTSVYLPKFLGPHKDRFKTWKIKTSFLQHIPFNAKLISPFRLLAPFVFKQFDFSGFDVVIVSATGAYTPNMIKKGNGIQICYCHTPPRYLYGYATAREWKKNVFFKVIGEIANHFLRLLDFKSSQNVDYFIANSDNIKARIKKFYRRDSTVIYPPVDIQELRIKNQELRENHNSKFTTHNSYYVAGGRLARPKHTDLIVKACDELDVPLKVFGKSFGGYESEFKIKNSKIEFVGEVSDSEKLELMRNAKAYVFAAEDEDFGITPVEAMGCGTAVIAYRSGGVVESVIDGKTGLFFDELNVESLKNVIKKFEKTKFDSSVIIKQAEKFSKTRFKKEISDFVEKVLKNEKTNTKTH